MAKEDSTVRNIRKWMKVGGIVTAGLATMMIPILIMYIEYAPQVRAARADSVVATESLAPAVVELQNLRKDDQAWADEVDEDLDKLLATSASHADMDKRLIRCEIYMEILGSRRGFPELPEPPEPDWDSDPMATMASLDKPEPRVRHIRQAQAQYEVPTSMSKARKKAAARIKAKCATDDPLCGQVNF